MLYGGVIPGECVPTRSQPRRLTRLVNHWLAHVSLREYIKNSLLAARAHCLRILIQVCQGQVLIDYRVDLNEWLSREVFKNLPLFHGILGKRNPDLDGFHLQDL